MIAEGTSVVLVSHSLPTVQAIADRVIWLDAGEIKLEGEPEMVIEAYENSIA